MRYYGYNYYNNYYNSYQGSKYYSNNYKYDNGYNYYYDNKYDNKYQNNNQNYKNEYIKTKYIKPQHLRDSDTQRAYRDKINNYNPYKDVSHVVGLNVAVTAMKQTNKIMKQNTVNEIQNYLNSSNNYKMESRVQNRIFDQFTDNKINQTLQGHKQEFTERQLERVNEIGQKASDFAKQAQSDGSGAQQVFQKIADTCNQIQSN